MSAHNPPSRRAEDDPPPGRPEPRGRRRGPDDPQWPDTWGEPSNDPRAVPPARTPTSGAGPPLRQRRAPPVPDQPWTEPRAPGPRPDPRSGPRSESRPDPRSGPRPEPRPEPRRRTRPRLPALDHAGVGGSAGRLATGAMPASADPRARPPPCRDPPGRTLRARRTRSWPAPSVARTRPGPEPAVAGTLGQPRHPSRPWAAPGHAPGRSRPGIAARPRTGRRARARSRARPRSTGFGHARAGRPRSVRPRPAPLGQPPTPGGTARPAAPALRPARHLRRADRTDRRHRPTDRCGAADRIRPPVGAVGPARTGATRHLRRPRTSARSTGSFPQQPGFGPPNQYGQPRPPGQGGGRPDQRPPDRRPPDQRPPDQRQYDQHPQATTTASTTSTRTTTDWDDEDDDSTTGHRAGHSHGHGHGPAAAVSARTRRVVLAILIPCMIATVAGLVLLWPGKVAPPPGDSGNDQRAYGTVTSVNEIPCPPEPDRTRRAADPNQPCGEAGVHVTSGTGSGTDIIVDLPQGPGAPTREGGRRHRPVVHAGGRHRRTRHVPDRRPPARTAADLRAGAVRRRSSSSSAGCAASPR